MNQAKTVNDSNAKGTTPKQEEGAPKPQGGAPESKVEASKPHAEASKPKGGASKSKSEAPKPKGTASKTDGAENRRFDRFDWKRSVQILWLDEHARGVSMILRTEDLSAGGIGLLSPSWVHLGRCGAVLLTDRPGHHSIRWLQVLHGRYVSERKIHVIGCKWIPTPENAPPIRIVEAAIRPQLEFDTDLSAKSI